MRKKENTLSAKASVGVLIAYWLSLGVFAAAGTAMFYTAFDGPHAPLFHIVVACLCWSFTLLGIIAAGFTETWTIKDNELHISIPLKKEPKIIPFEEILSYAEIKNAKNGQKDLSLFTENKKYHLSLSLYVIPEDFRAAITKGKTEDVEYEARLTRAFFKYLGLLLLLLGIYVISGLNDLDQQALKEFDPGDYLKVIGTLSQPLEVEKYREGKHGPSTNRKIVFPLSEYEGIVFEIPDRLMNYTFVPQLVNNASPGDSVEIFVTESLDSIVFRSSQGSLWQRWTTSKHLFVHGFRSKGNEYLSIRSSFLEQRNQAKEGKQIRLVIGIVCIILGIGLAIWGLRPIPKQKK